MIIYLFSSRLKVNIKYLTIFVLSIVNDHLAIKKYFMNFPTFFNDKLFCKISLY